MAFRIGLVGLCTSHPGSWLPIIRQMIGEGLVDVEVVAAWDSGETRPEGFAAEFCKEQDIPRSVERLGDMVDVVDGVIVHTTNWDRHVEHARPFVDAGKSVLLDKPIAGNLADADQVLDWVAGGARITGGSSLRHALEVREFLAEPVEDRGELHTAFGGCGTDEFNYGIHAYSLMCGLMGPGLRSVRYLGVGGQKLLKMNWRDGKVGLLSVGAPDGLKAPLPMHLSAVTTKALRQIVVDTKRIYRSLLEAELPYLCGQVEDPPMPMAELLEPELGAMAARMSWMNGGAEIFLTDLRQDEPGYDGTQFAIEYRRSRMG